MSKLFFEWILGDEDDFIPEKEEPDVFSLIAKKLPQALKVKKKVEVLEETGPIPEKKDYSDKVEEPPAKKAKRSGPVKITIPSLSTFQDEEDESEFTHDLGNWMVKVKRN